MTPDLDRLPPHSLEAEQGVLGCIMLSATECLDECIRRISTDSFYDLRHRTLYATMLEMYDRREPIDTITLQQRLKDRQQLDGIGGLAFLSALPDSVPSAANLGYYLDIVRNGFTKRQLIQAATELSQTLMENGREPTQHQLEILRDRCADAIAGEASDRLKQLAESRRFDPNYRPPDIPPVFALTGIRLCTRRNLTVIDAGVKAGKSAFIGAMISSVIKPPGIEADTFGVTSTNDGSAILHFDLEQDQDDHWRMIDGILRRTKLTELPDYVHSFWLLGVERGELHAIIKDKLRFAVDAHGGIHSIFLDGYADLVADVNDPEECNDFVIQLHAVAIEYNCPIIGALHQNPGKNNERKTRGHLGSQLERKSESNLTMEKDGEITKVWSLKQRGAPIMKGKGPSFRWSDEHRMHISCEMVLSEKQKRKIERMRRERNAAFSEHPSLRYTDLVSEIMKHCGEVSIATAKRRIEEWVEVGIIHQPLVNLYAPKD